jgi:hypothetical protein
MKFRVKVCKYHFSNGYYYKVQIKTFLFWKTKWECDNITAVNSIVNELKTIDEYNNTKKENFSFFVWGVRQPLYNSPGYSSDITLFKTLPELDERRNSITANRWGDTHDEVGSLKIKSLFGDKVLEPRKYKITIEKV